MKLMQAEVKILTENFHLIEGLEKNLLPFSELTKEQILLLTILSQFGYVLEEIRYKKWSEKKDGMFLIYLTYKIKRDTSKAVEKYLKENRQ